MANKKQQKPTLSPITGLTPQQEQAATMLASGDNISTVARQLNLNRSTLYEWQENTAFKCFYNQQCHDHQQAVKNALFGLHSAAVDTLTDLLNNGNENTRLKAAMWLLERVASVEVGETKIRAALKAQCTHSTFDEGWDKLNEREYKRELERYGLSDD
jgi:hypothetical protein